MSVSRDVISLVFVVTLLSKDETRAALLVISVSVIVIRDALLVISVSKDETRDALLVISVSKDETRDALLVISVSKDVIRDALLVTSVSVAVIRDALLVISVSNDETRAALLVISVSRDVISPVFVVTLLSNDVTRAALLVISVLKAIPVSVVPSPKNSVACTFVLTITLPVVTIDSAAFVKLTVLFTTFPWLDACCNVTVPEVFDNKPPSPKKNLPELTLTLPDVSKDSFVFVRMILFDVVAPDVVTCCMLPTLPPTPAILDKPPPSPMNRPFDCNSIATVAMFPFSRAS